MIPCRSTLTLSALAALGLAIAPIAPGTAHAQAAKPAAAPAASDKLVERGRYLVKIAGCNDCHTDGYMQAEGKVPEKEWLTGSSFGWRGPWGTTYAINLRMHMQDRTEAEWLKEARKIDALPPMPWFAVREMHTDDLRAIYRFIRQLGPVGKPAPAFVPPEKEPKPPYALFPSPPK